MDKWCFPEVSTEHDPWTLLQPCHKKFGKNIHQLNLREINGKPSSTLANTELGPTSTKTRFSPDLLWLQTQRHLMFLWAIQFHLHKVLQCSALQSTTEIKLARVANWEPTECTFLRKSHQGFVMLYFPEEGGELLSCLMLRGPSVTSFTNPLITQSPHPAANYRKKSESDYPPLLPRY